MQRPMPQATVFVLASYAVQWAASVLMALVVWQLHDRYRRTALRLIAASWLALSVVFLGGGVALATATTTMAPWHPLRWSASAVGQVAGYLQAALLLLGSVEVVLRRSLDRRAVGWILAAAVLAGVGSTMPFVADPDAGLARFFVRFGVRSLVTGVAFVAAGVLVWRRRDADRFGQRLVSAAFALYGLQLLHYFAVASWQLATSRFASYTAYLGHVDFFLLVMIGLGTVVWMLEEERERTLRATREADYLASHDHTTGLPNRSTLLRHVGAVLEQAVRMGGGGAVAALDLDGFRAVNDSLGATAGDRLLAAVAHRLRAALPADAVVARIGSDEFGALLPTAADADEVRRVAGRVRRELGRRLAIDGHELFPTACIGAAVFPADGVSADALLRAAEAALHAAQQQGRDRFLPYAPSLEALTAERLRFEHAVRNAVLGRRFVLHYQPIFGLESGRVVACEALVRWRHPTRGLLRPDQFLAVVESIGALAELEWFVLETACRQMRRWRHDGCGPPLLSVNLSPQRFQHADTVGRAARIAADAAVDPSAIQLEITERSALPQTEVTFEVLRGLKATGFRIAIDDFGSGYSSLATLRAAPVDCLKLDGGFVRTIDGSERDAAFLSSIVAVSHGLGIPVVAEGVERESQLQILRRLGCDAAQGYLLGPPVTADRVARIVAGAVGSPETRDAG